MKKIPIDSKPRSPARRVRILLPKEIAKRLRERVGKGEFAMADYFEMLIR